MTKVDHRIELDNVGTGVIPEDGYDLKRKEAVNDKNSEQTPKVPGVK